MKELIKKYNIMLVKKDGEDALKVNKKPSLKDYESIKENKSTIISMIKEMEIEKKEKADREKSLEIKRQSSIKKLAVVKSGPYLMDIEITYVVPYTKEQEKGYSQWAIDAGLHFIALEQETIDIKDFEEFGIVKNVTEREADGILGSCESSIWYITEEEKEQITNKIQDFKNGQKEIEQDFDIQVGQVEIISTKEINTAIRKGFEYVVSYLDNEYRIINILEDISYGDNPHGDWVGITNIIPDVDEKTKKVLLRKF